MNQETIPDNNLPFYIQQYDVNIIDDKEESFGKVLYTTVGVLPSTEKTKYGWSLNLTGYLKPNVDTYNIVYDFSKSDYENQKKIIFIKNVVSGTFNICGQVLDASKIIEFDYTYSNSALTIKLDTSKWDFRLKKEVLFSYQLNLDSYQLKISAPPPTTTTTLLKFNNDSTRDETNINGLTVKLAGVSTRSTGTTTINVYCLSGNSNCKCSSGLITATIQTSSLQKSYLVPWTKQYWKTLTDECQDESIGVLIDNYNLSAMTVTVQWYRTPPIFSCDTFNINYGTYDIYLQIIDTVSGKGICPPSNSCWVAFNNIYLYDTTTLTYRGFNFSINNTPFNILLTNGGKCIRSGIYVFYFGGEVSLLPDGKSTKVYLFGPSKTPYNITYTYTADFDPCTQTTCLSSGPGPYKIGTFTIEESNS